MPIMTDSDLANALDNGELTITPRPTSFQPASIDLSVGEETFISSQEKITKLSNENLLLNMPPGEMVLVVTRERIELSARIVGHIGLRSSFARQGLVLLAGLQIDPGFKGYLHIVLCNLSPSIISLAYAEPFCTVEFHKLAEDTKKPYIGPYQQQGSITPNEIRDIRKGSGFGLSEAIQNMQVMSRDVASLKDSVEKLIRASSIKETIMITLLATLVCGVVSALWVMIAGR
jgi:deoxycytidine triphosphate deaminase